ncbi:hypothetical protein Asp14428_30020 [Actinoplanes sp. NBRC 14428]|uniref:Putative adhesin n=1 Tax=Pseudosporangium ferrugineum TaxID=439699 RepID=A0A2T0RS30_9ACTN|nr:DUF4097 family beta strand repeat-containing protein [Pseudosporangium ferrugineum]PRY23961.1 putative adhesin [Pseudosporangium ferrugineum]BCJ51527.1 hypothetical protein Asp14428_30020 [Actinoplanes sp. NBRC 14428]
MTARLSRRAGALTLVAAAAAATLTGCDQGFGAAKLTFDDTEKVKITEVVVSGTRGDVSVRTAPIAETRIKRIVRSDGADPGVSYRLTGTSLAVDTSCGPNCRVSYDIEAPTGVAVRGELTSGGLNLVQVGSADVTVNSGEIHLDRITGRTTATARSGNIVAEGLAGPATLTTRSGNIDGTNLTGGNAITAEATSGNIELELMQPASVTARVSSGNVDLAVPPGAYRVAHHVGSGDFESDVSSDPKATAVLDVRAGSGNATITSQ